MIRQSSDDTSGGDIASDVGSEIKVTLDRWSVGQLGVTDLVVAAAVIMVAVVLAWVISRLVRRAGRNLQGAARAAIGTIGQLFGGAVLLLGAALALEILGFSLGPILILILILIVGLLLLRPLLTNLSSGLLLQLRGALSVGGIVMTTDDVFGIVREITTRTVTIDTSDGRRVHVPNSDVLNDTIANYTTLGRRRSAFEVMVGCGEDLTLVLSTIRLALSQVPEIHTDPPPEAEVARLVGRLVVIRVLVWHSVEQRAERAAVDAGIRAVVNALQREGIEPDGPTLLELGSDHPPTGSGERV